MSLYSRHTYAAETVRIAAVAIAVLAFAASAAAQGNGRVRGRVVNEDGNPMEGVRVTTANPESNPPEFGTETASNGRYSILGLISGQWLFRVECAEACAEANGSPYGYRPSEGVWPVLQSGNSPVDFTLRRVRHPLQEILGDAAVAGVDLNAVMASVEAADEAYNSGNLEAAITGYEAVLEQLPQWTLLLVRIGAVYARMPNYEASIAAYDRALEIDPDNADALQARARVRVAAGAASEEEIQLLETAASSLSASREDLYNQGEVAFARGDLDEARDWYEKAIAVDGNWAPPLFKRALVALNDGDIAGAKEYFQRVVDIDPNSDEGTQAQATLSALP